MAQKRVRSTDQRQIVAPGAKRPSQRFMRGAKPGNMEYERVDAVAPFIADMVAEGFSRERIARRIINPNTGKPISVETLVKYYGDELEFGLDDAKLKMARSVFSQGVGFPGVPNPNFGKMDVRKKISGVKNPNFGRLDKRKWMVEPIAPNIGASIWWEKTRAGKKEGVSIEHTGANGQALAEQKTVIVIYSNGRGRGETPVLDLLPREYQDVTDK